VSEVEAFLGRYPADVRAICQRLREVMRAAMPDAVETLFVSQNHLGYSVTGRGYDRIAYLCPMQSYVRFGFMYGSALSDPEHLLTGEGKRLRHVKVRSLSEAELPALHRLAEAAYADAEARRMK
jgi:hypothetical protein